MSRNFELLSEIESDLDFKQTTPTSVPAATVTVPRVLHDSFRQELVSLAQVFLSQGADAPRVVALCGVDRESGSSGICRDLGLILASRSGRPVCLIDSDSWPSRLSKILNIAVPMASFTSDAKQCIQVAPNMWYAALETCGPTGKGAPASLPGFTERVSELRASFEFILIDAPGTSARTDVAMLGQIADAAILVLEANSTRKAAALRAKKSMEAGKAKLLGTILHDRTFPIPATIYNKL